VQYRLASKGREGYENACLQLLPLIIDHRDQDKRGIFPELYHPMQTSTRRRPYATATTDRRNASLHGLSEGTRIYGVIAVY
jgi:hypothetical protein